MVYSKRVAERVNNDTAAHCFSLRVGTRGKEFPALAPAAFHPDAVRQP
jgi:hypothetical protein